MTPSEVLLKAAALLSKGWTQEFHARRANGTSCGALNPKAVCWCAEGAIIKACGHKMSPLKELAWRAYSTYTQEVFGVSGVSFNDKMEYSTPVIAALIAASKRIAS